MALLEVKDLRVGFHTDDGFVHAVDGISYEAIQRNDLPTIQGTVLFLALGVCIMSLVVDILYAFLDPRVRY